MWVTMENAVIDIAGHGDVNEIFAYISIDAKGKTGICACLTQVGWVPCVGMTREDMPKYKAFLEQQPLPDDTRVVLVKYRSLEILEELTYESRGLQ